MIRCLGESRAEREPANERRAEDDSGKNFPHHLRLPQSHEQVPQQLSQTNQKQEYKEDGCEIGVRQFWFSDRLRWVTRSERLVLSREGGNGGCIDRRRQTDLA